MIKLIENNKNIPFFKYIVKDHLKIKSLMLKNIDNLGEYSFKNNLQNISNTDWYLPSSIKRNYIDNLMPSLIEIINDINNIYDIDQKLNINNFWFQQYKTHDFHEWHIHSNSVFSCVYYLDIDNKTSKTTFQLFDKSEFELEMNEGEILMFPSFLKHTSKPNISDKTKTIISFNIN